MDKIVLRYDLGQKCRTIFGTQLSLDMCYTHNNL